MVHSCACFDFITVKHIYHPRFPSFTAIFSQCLSVIHFLKPSPVLSSAEHASEHPRSLLMGHHTLVSKSSVGASTAVRRNRKCPTGSACTRFMISYNSPIISCSTWYRLGLLEVAELREFAVRTGRNASEGADSFGDGIACQPEFVVLLFEHQVQRMEHRSNDVPVEIVCLQI